MRFEGFHSSADLVGRRVWLSWDYALDPLETPGQVPDVLVRRKGRDFAFPPLVPGDPYLRFDSAAFPPAPVPGSLAVTDLPDEERFEDGLRITRRSVSVAAINSGVPLERQRVVRSIFHDRDGAPVRVRTELLDADGLTALEPAYYELDDGSAPGPEEVANYRGIAVPGELHGINRTLWEMLPNVFRANDSGAMPETAFVPGIPETGRGGGQLRRFLDMFGMGFDMLRNSAEALRGLNDLDTAPPDYVRLIGQAIGWDPSTVVSLPQQRNEVRTATRLFDVLGTVQSLRALVTHQTGWRSQVAELAQNIVRSNVPVARSLYLRRELAAAPGTWRGANDAFAIFAFPPAGASGAGSAPAVLVSGVAEPFALFSGAELTLSVDGDAPGRVRFGPADFEDIGAATAAEVAEVINRSFDNISASDSAGSVRIETILSGSQASVRAEESRQSLIAISDVGSGRIAPVDDGDGHLRIFYRDRSDPGQSDDSSAAGRSAGLRGIFQKSWGHGEWRDSERLPAWTSEASDLGAAGLPAGRTFLFWSERDRLRFASGAPRPPLPASLGSQRAEPFVLTAGTKLTLETPAGAESFTINAADYAAPAAATALELATAINSQLANVACTPLADGSIRIDTVALGDDSSLAVDLSQSTAARALGFGARELRSAGRWDPAMDWTVPGAGPTTWNEVADPAVMADSGGGAMAAWAEHQNGAWQIRQAHWDEQLTLATPAGAAVQASPGAPWTVFTTLDGLPSDVIRAVAVDSAGARWFATDSGLARRRADGTWTTFTTLDGLISNDIRALAILPSGTIACATPAGLSEVDLAGAVTNTIAGPLALPSSDVRALAATGSGELWVATAAGLARRGPGGWTSWSGSDGLPMPPLSAVAVAPGNRAAAASGDGLSIFEDGVWRHFTASDGLPSNLVRSLAFAADGGLLAATDSGLGIYRNRTWRIVATSDGLPSNDLLSVAESADGRLLIGTAAGLAVGGQAGWSLIGTAQGLPSTVIANAHSEWSAPLIIADGDGGEREPFLALEAGGETWLVWSHRESGAAGIRDSWTLRLRRFDPATGSWAAAQALAPPPPLGAADREPNAQPAPGGGFRIFFSTDRSGGAGLGWLSADSLGVPGAVSLLPVETQESGNPAAVGRPGGDSWLFHRSDAPLVKAQIAAIAPPGSGDRRTIRLPDAGALAHRGGARAPVMAHLARHSERRRFGDFLTYTPEYPDRPDSELLGSPHLYTRRTLALYMRQAPFGIGVTKEEIARLLQLLNRLKPINLRLLLVIAPDPLTEIVYPPGADIGESWMDNAPLIESLGGIADSSSVVIPGLDVLISNELASRSADALDPATLLRRTWFPDLL